MNESTIEFRKRYSHSHDHYFEDFHFWQPEYSDFEWPEQSDKCDDNTQWIYKSYCSSDGVKKGMHLKKKKNTRHLIIFDWDDTLFFTTFIHERFNFNQNKLQYAHFFDKETTDLINKTGEFVFKMFLKLIRFYGADNIKIVTSALDQWPETCMTKLGPIISSAYSELFKLIKAEKIETISARSEYLKNNADERQNLSNDGNGDKEPQMPEYDYEDSVKWKKYTFDQIIKKHFTDAVCEQADIGCCVQSIGDSWAEYYACRSGSDWMQLYKGSYRYLLRIVLVDEPDLNEFYEQFLIVGNIMDEKIEMLSTKNEEMGIWLKVWRFVQRKDNRFLIECCLAFLIAVLVSISMFVL